MPTPEIKQILGDTESKPDQLHGVVQQLTSNPHWDREHYDAVRDLATHPSSSTDHMTKLYTHMKGFMTGSDPDVGGYKPHYKEQGAIAEIARSGKMASADAEDYLKRTAGNSVTDEAAFGKVGGVSKDLLKDLTIKAWENNKDIPDFGLDHDFAHDLFSRRGTPPIEQTLTDAQRPEYERTKKFDEFFLNRLGEKHESPESIARSVALFNGEMPSGMSSYSYNSARNDFINNNKDLNSEQLESLFESSRNGDHYYARTAASSTLKHENASPELLSKLALHTGDVYDGNHITAALQNSKLPQETINSIIDTYDSANPRKIDGYTNVLEALSGNEGLSKDTVNKMYEKVKDKPKVSKYLIKHNNASESSIEDYWSKSDKKTDDTSMMINSVPNIPKSVLVDIVSKNKNQELSIAALKHQKADISVVQAGLKRRAVAVQEAAALNPLVARTEVINRIKDGRMNAVDIYEDKKTKNSFGDISEDDYRTISETNTKGNVSEYVRNDLRLKYHLSIDQKAPSDVRTKSKKDLIEAYKAGNEHALDPMKALAFNLESPDHEAQLLIAGNKDDLDSLTYGALSLKSLSSEFIDKAYSTLPEGDSKRFVLARHANSSDDTFFSAIKDEPQMMKNTSAVDYRSWGKKELEDNITIFDDRFRNAEPEKVKEGYSKLLEIGSPEVFKTVLKSNTVPKDMYNNIFLNVDNQTKKSVLEDNPEKFKLLAPDVLSDSLNGKYNYGENNAIQSLAIKHLDMDNNDHVQILSNFIDRTRPGMGAMEPGHLSFQTIAEQLNDSTTLDHPNFDKIVDISMNTDSPLGPRLATMKANQLRDPNYLINKINGTSQDPETKVLKWQHAIQNIRSSEGNYDFLYNMPEDVNGDIRNAAFSRGLFSKDIVMNEAIKSPNNLDKALTMSRGNEKTALIEKVLSTNDKDLTHVMIKNINSDSLIHPDHYSGKMAKSHLDYSTDLVGRITSTMMNNGSHESIPHLIDAIKRGTGGRKKFTDAHKKTLINTTVKSIDTSTSTDEQKNAAKANIYETLGSRSNLISTSFLTNLVKGAVKIRDVDVLMKISDSSDSPPASIQKEITSMLKNPADLTTNQVLALSSVITRGNPDPEASKRVMNTLNDRLNTSDDPTEKRDIATKTIDISASNLRGEYNEKSYKLFAGHLEEKLNSEDDYISRHAALAIFNNLSTHPTVPTKDKVKTLLKIPKEISLATTYQAISTDVLNDPDFLLESTDGWKLNSYVYAAGRLDKPALNTIAERVSAFGDPDVVNKFVSLSTRNENSDYDTTVSLLKKNDSFGSLGQTNLEFSSIEDNIHTQASQALIDVSLENIDNSDSYLTSGSYINEIAQSILRSENDQAKKDETLSKVIQSHLKVLDKHSAVLDSSDITPNEAVAFLQVHNKFLNILTQRPLSTENSVDVLSSIKEYGINHEKISPLGNSSGYKHPAQFTTDWAAQTDATGLDWPSIIKTKPDLFKHFSSFKNLPKEAIDSVDFSNISNPDNKASLVNDMRLWPQSISKDTVPSFVKAFKDFSNSLNDGETTSFQSFFNKTLYNVAAIHSKNVSDDDMDFFETIAPDSKVNFIINGAGSKNLVTETLKKLEWGDLFIIAAQQANINKESAAVILEKISGENVYSGDKVKVMVNLTKNTNTDGDVLNHLYDQAENLGRSDKDGIYNKISQHHNVNYDLFDKIYEKTKDKYKEGFHVGESFNPAFLNKKFGGKLFRSIPISIPEKVAGYIDTDSDKVVYSAEFSKDRDAIRTALSLVPPEGISFQDFKKKNKSIAETNAVKQVFIGAEKQVVRPEDLSLALNQHGGDYHITYSQWTSSLQRHLGDNSSSAPNLVMQLNTGEHMQNELSKDEKLWKFFQLVQKAANRVDENQIGGHPVTPHIAAWVRIDPSGGKDGWVIEEFQSDFTSSLRSEIADIANKYPGGLDMEGDFYHPDEMSKYQKQIEKVLGNWHEAAVRGVTELAKKQGVSNLFLHGEGVRATLSGMQPGKENPVWMQHMYNRHPKNNGWEQVDYQDYPVKNQRFAEQVKDKGRSTQCWKIKLT